MRKLDTAVLHIGFEKTGTSSLIATLNASHAALARHGILVPQTERDHIILSMAFRDNDAGRWARTGLKNEAEATAYTAKKIDEITAQVAAFDGDTVLFSAESLAGMQRHETERLARYMDTLAHRTVILCYVRHPIGAATSLSQQLIKTGHLTLPDAEARPASRPARRRLMPYIHTFGQDALQIVPFDRASLKDGRIQNDVFHRVGYRGPLDDITMVDRNESLTMPAVVLKSLMNQLAACRVPEQLFLYAIQGPRFTLPEAAIARAEEDGTTTLAWLEKRFDLRLPRPTPPVREALEPMFDDEAMRAIDEAARKQKRPMRRLVRDAAEHIKAGDFYGRRIGAASHKGPFT